MKQDGTPITHTHTPIHILLADDDIDDRSFLARVLSELHIPTHLTTVEDGEQLFAFLSENCKRLPDILFIDFNMPRKNGAECLSEIKSTDELKSVPVVILSTSVHDADADLIYNGGAHYYIRKGEITDLKRNLHHVLSLLARNKFTQPARSKFILSIAKA